MSRDIFQKFPARQISSAIRGYDIEVFVIELRLLEYYWHSDSNLEFPQLKAHSNIGGIERLPHGWNEFNIFPGPAVVV
jgi:hypothetical protein